MALRGWLALAAGVCAGLAAPSASSADRVPLRLFWDGSACGNKEDFAARVLQRNRAIRFVASGEDIAVRLSIRQTPGGLDARVRIESKGRAPVTRRIQSPDCDDALDALALVVAIGVESPTSTGCRARAPAVAARRAADKPAPKPPAPPKPTEPAPSVPEPVPDAAPPSAEPAPVEAAAPSATTQPVNVDEVEPTAGPAVAVAPTGVTDTGLTPPPPKVASEGLVIGAGLAALVSVGVAPEPLLGGAIWVSAEWDRAGLWAPELVLDALHQERDGHDEPRGEASFALNALSLALCPLRLGSSTLELRPCVTGEWGRVGSEGGQTYSPRDQTRPWASLGAGVSASAVFGILELRASLGVAAPLYRDSFRFGAECSGAACEADVFHRVAPLIWSGALGAGLTPR